MYDVLTAHFWEVSIVAGSRSFRSSTSRSALRFLLGGFYLQFAETPLTVEIPRSNLHFGDATLAMETISGVILLLIIFFKKVRFLLRFLPKEMRSLYSIVLLLLSHLQVM